MLHNNQKIDLIVISLTLIPFLEESFMNKRFFLSLCLPATLLATTSIKPRHFFDFEEDFREMICMHERMMERHQELFTLLSEPKDQIARSEISMRHNEQTSTLDISVTNAATENEKTEALFNGDSEKEELAIEVPLASGTLVIDYRRLPTNACFSIHAPWVVTISLKSKTAQDDKKQQHTNFFEFSRSTTTETVPDFNLLPKVVFDKETKMVTVSIATEKTTEKKQKTVIPVDIK